MGSYRLGRTAFKMQTAEEASNHAAYYKTLTWQERLRIANYLNSVACNYPENNPPKIDRTALKNALAQLKMGNIFNQDFRHFINCFNTNHVRYVLVGGYSVILHGYSRTTGDMDLWVARSPENYRNIKTAFFSFGMPVFDMTEEAFLYNKDLTFLLLEGRRLQ